jgi:uncharacterized protein YodC (DUF2158 family)
VILKENNIYIMSKFKKGDSVRVKSDIQKTCMSVAVIFKPMTAPNFTNDCFYLCQWLDDQKHPYEFKFVEDVLVLC